MLPTAHGSINMVAEDESYAAPCDHRRSSRELLRRRDDSDRPGVADGFQIHSPSETSSLLPTGADSPKEESSEGSDEPLILAQQSGRPTAWRRRLGYFHETRPGLAFAVCGCTLLGVGLAALVVLEILGSIGSWRGNSRLRNLGMSQRTPVPLAHGNKEGPVPYPVCTARIPTTDLLFGNNVSVSWGDTRVSGNSTYACLPSQRRRAGMRPSCCKEHCDPYCSVESCNVRPLGCYASQNQTWDSRCLACDATVKVQRGGIHYFLLDWLAVGRLHVFLQPPPRPSCNTSCDSCSFQIVATLGDHSKLQSEERTLLRKCFPSGKRSGTFESWCKVDLGVQPDITPLSSDGFPPNAVTWAVLELKNVTNCSPKCFGASVFVDVGYKARFIGSLFGLVPRIAGGACAFVLALALLLPQCIAQFSMPVCSLGFILSLVAVLQMPLLLFVPLTAGVNEPAGVVTTCYLTHAPHFFGAVFVCLAASLMPFLGLRMGVRNRKCYVARVVPSVLLGLLLFGLWITSRFFWSGAGTITIAVFAVWLGLVWFVLLFLTCVERLCRSRLMRCGQDFSRISICVAVLVFVPINMWFPIVASYYSDACRASNTYPGDVLVCGFQLSVAMSYFPVMFVSFYVLILFLPCPRVPCSHVRSCQRFLSSIELRAAAFDRRYSKCYCRQCLVGPVREIRLEPSRRGLNLSRRCSFPNGWVKFGLKVSSGMFKDWCIAYHGTSSRSVKSIVEYGQLLRAGDTTPSGDRLQVAPGHIDYRGVEDPELRRELKAFVRSRFVSPSIEYAAQYAPASQFKDDFFQMVFEVRIKPDSFNDELPLTREGGPRLFEPGQQHTLANDFRDPLFAEECLEWFTDREAVIVLTGLLVRLIERKKGLGVN